MGFRKSRYVGENIFGRTRSDDYDGGGGGSNDDDDNDDIDGDDLVMTFLMMIVMLIMIMLLLMMTTMMMCIQIFVCCHQLFNYFNLLLRCMTRTPNSDPRI